MIQIISDTTNEFFRCVEMTTGKHSVMVFVYLSRSEVRVIVQNAMNQAWRGLGKEFASIQAAIENYKTADIKAMLQAV